MHGWALDWNTFMATDIDSLKEKVRRWTLVLGVLQITVGCMIGFIPPSAVAWFRGIVSAHIELTANGVLMIALGLLVRDLRLSASLLKVWFALVQIGTWSNGAAGFGKFVHLALGEQAVEFGLLREVKHGCFVP